MSSYAVSLSEDRDLSNYLSYISKIKMLTQDEEYRLAVEAQEHQNRKAVQSLVISHLPLVVKIAYGYKSYGLPMVDLISEGNIGLMKAVAKFDYHKGFRLTTYAIWWIKAYITDFILNSWSLVKTGTLLARKRLFFSLNKMKEKLSVINNNFSDNNLKVISQELKVTPRDVIEVNNMLSKRDLSLQEKIGGSEDSNTTFADILVDENNNPEETFLKKQQLNHYKNLVQAIFKILSDRENFILKKRYFTEKPASLEEIAKIIGISRERVRQIESKAIKKAKEYFSDKKLLLT